MISKKELLNKMNISYGQLYRWKREGLIPDEWFIKQSVSTGQETFFDENLIIPRIQEILDKKNDYQLDELKKFFGDNYNDRKYTIREIVLIEELDPIIIKIYSKYKNLLSVYDIILIYIMGKEEIELYDYCNYNFDSLNYKLYLLKNNEFIIGKDIVFSKNYQEVKKVYDFNEIYKIIIKEL